jgi:DNA-binding transcriptional regulator of glucitol operon
MEAQHRESIITFLITNFCVQIFMNWNQMFLSYLSYKQHVYFTSEKQN